MNWQRLLTFAGLTTLLILAATISMPIARNTIIVLTAVLITTLGYYWGTEDSEEEE